MLVLHNDDTHIKHTHHIYHTQLRVFWYLVHVALEEESVQLKGFVLMNNAHLANNLKQFDRVYMRMQYNAVNTGLPMKVRAIHTCHVPSLMAFFFPVLKFIMGREGRLRHRVHSETPIISSLETYGLYKETLPVVLGGDFRFDGPSWLEKRRKIEQTLYDQNPKKNIDKAANGTECIKAASDV